MESTGRNWPRIGLVTLILLAAVTATCLSVWFALAPGQDLDNADDYRCDPAEVAQVSMAVQLLVQSDGLDVPQLTEIVDLRMPAKLDLASALQMDPDKLSYRSAFLCLLDVPGGPAYDATQWRNDPPRVVDVGGVVSAHDTVQTRLDLGTDINCGLFWLHRDQFGKFAIQLAMPDRLAEATWTSVTITAPPGWLSSPVPWPPTTFDGTTAEWRDLGKHPAAVEARLTTDFRAGLNTAGAIPPWNVWYALDYWFDSIFLPGTVLIWLAALKRRRSRRPDAANYGATRWSRLVAMPGRAVRWMWKNRKAPNPFGYLFAVVILLGGRTALGVISTAAGDTGQARLWEIDWIESVTVALLVAVAALVCGLSWVATLCCTVLQAGALTYLRIVEGGWRDSHLRDASVAYAASGFLVTVVVWAIMLTGVMRLFRWKVHSAWLWASAGVIALILVIERLLTDLAFYARVDWVGFTPGASHLLNNFQYLPSTLLDNSGSFLFMLLVPCIWAITRDFLNPPAVRDTALTLSVATLLLFWIGPWGWGVSIAGWYLPLWFLLVPVLGAVLRRRERRNWLLGFTETLARRVDRTPMHELRVQARDWQAARREQSVNNQAASSGKAATPTRGLSARALRLRPRRTSTIAHDRESKVTPLDVVLAIGPSRSPWKNMVSAVKIGAACGAPVAVFMTWLDFHTYPVRLPHPGESIVSDVAAGYLWFLIVYVFGAATLGLFWQHLPGKRGPIRALWVAAVYALFPVLNFVIPKAVGGFATSEHLVDALVFTAVMVIVGIVFDVQALGPAPPQRQRRALLTAYGMQNAPAQLTFLVAQAAAILGIVSFLRNGGSAPAAPSIDPALLARLGQR